MKATTSSVITTVIRKVASQSLADSLTVKRKYKTNRDGSLKRWWYVVRGERSDVEQLEQEWENIATHTGWKLQTVFRFDASDVPTPQSFDVPNTPTSDEQVLGTQPIVPCISPHNNDAVEPVQSLEVKDNLSVCSVGSGGQTMNPSNHDNGPDCIHIITPTPVSDDSSSVADSFLGPMHPN